MIAKRLTSLLITMIPLALVALSFFTLQVILTLLHGGVCNYSSTNLWLTVTESGRQKAYMLAPGHCTNVFKQDAEAIWGRDCNTDPCTYQAWKVGAGRFDINNDEDSHSDSILQINGWGAGSRWHVTRSWPKPDLSMINYSLIK
jgi:hypothetical protein